MHTDSTFFHAEHLIVMDGTGRLDLKASYAALERLAADPEFNVRDEILMDLRSVECQMSIADISELARAMAPPGATFVTWRKIAVLIAGRADFDHAKFLALCATNRGLNVKAFEDYDKANEWLGAALPLDPKAFVAA